MNTLYWTIYGIGVVLFPVLVGTLLPNKEKFKVFDDGIPVFLLSFMWPFVLAMAAVAMLVLGITALAGFLWTFLMELGSSFGRKLEKKEVLKEDGCK